MEMVSVRDLDAALEEADCVVITTDHSAYDWGEMTRRQMAWQELDEFLSGIHRRPTVYSPAQIKTEITAAREEVKESRCGTDSRRLRPGKEVSCANSNSNLHN